VDFRGGGVLKRSGSGPPPPKCVWEGLVRLAFGALRVCVSISLFQSSNEPEGQV